MILYELVERMCLNKQSISKCENIKMSIIESIVRKQHPVFVHYFIV